MNGTTEATYESWRSRVEGEVANHEARGKWPKAVPASDAEWRALYEDCPRAIYAAWYVLTGKHAGRGEA